MRSNTLIYILGLVLLHCVEAGLRIKLEPRPKTIFRDFETHHLHPVVGFADDRVKVTNYQDFQYYGEILFGSG
jgi:hypothetical protein